MIVAVLCAGILTGCASLPSLEGRSVSTVITDTAHTRIGRTMAPLVAAHPGTSGIYPLRNARDAFAARSLLAQSAERTLDVQYYIWRKDMTGSLLLDALHDAADRGVRVRFLLDDNNTAGLDPVLAALDAHPNIEVRLFNPFALRSMRWLGYLTDFSRLNRRMHNKSFTADNQATIIGGRNIGDAYFGATNDVLFADLDVLAIGPIVDAVSRDFDRYWASGASYPLRRLLPPAADAPAPSWQAGASYTRNTPHALAYIRTVHESPFERELGNGTLPFEWARTQIVSDSPDKALGKAPRADQFPDKLKQAIGEPKSEVELVSPYFVPTSSGVATFAAMAQRGMRISVLTNALEATDVRVVHAGYAKRRKELLAAGVRLFEMKRLGPEPEERRLGGFSGGSSGSSLHAKTFAVDRSRVFIGSFNFDPRSARLNTELGFIIESPALANQIADAFARRVPFAAYEALLDQDGSIYWIERRDGEILRHDTEPGAGFWQRAGIFLLSLLPFDWLL
ncbi:MAG TPA: phospholipase D family protein [Noviherbaspirillum sp.]|uniref:phospholipase D family protein n=1 Tax=Noviherbaspirillum sp. TaxID=1926288 RepID=UPI002B46B51D|nr:phospholipase D family protein [Noviherbaspirillum sp.]HJV85238.1 phospholipase D family protein [Noviherbaspirillum sp.]